jgi:hypothetical protein
MHPGFGFGLFPITFFVVFGLAFFIIVTTIVQNAKRNRINNNSPRVTSAAEVVTKRTHVWGDHSHTDYYATFQFESGDRLELEIPHNQFGYLVEGDKGNLTFQGTRFLEFQRT